MCRRNCPCKAGHLFRIGRIGVRELSVANQIPSKRLRTAGDFLLFLYCLKNDFRNLSAIRSTFTSMLVNESEGLQNLYCSLQPRIMRLIRDRV